MNANAQVLYAYPIYTHASTGKRFFLNDEIVARLKVLTPDVGAQIQANYGLRLSETLSAIDNVYVFKLTAPKAGNPFRVCRELLQDAGLLWAEPNVGQEVLSHAYPPNDPELGDEWHVRNTGQQAIVGADAKIYDAWGPSGSYGSPGIRIAIVGDGVETTHLDLQANIIQGYDFYNNDTDPNPATVNDNHDTAVAGVAAAVADNNRGVTGVAGRCRILPVKVFRDSAYTSATAVYRALVYAADNADVINFSWGFAVPSGTITAGFTYANSRGRDGKGCPAFVSVGNSASGSGALSWAVITEVLIYPGLAAGKYRAVFSYEKDATGSAGDDAMWLAEVYVPLDGQSGYSVDTFDAAAFPTGWTPGGAAGWTLNNDDPPHYHGTSRFALRSGAITHNQRSTLTSPLLDITASKPGIYFRRWMSSEAPDDELVVRVLDQNNTEVGEAPLGGGQVTGRNTALIYPANLSAVAGVGASSDFDYRSHYSCFGAELDFVAPSSGGFASLNDFFWTIHGIRTTDRTGAAGYSAADYYDFGGTSASAPIAAGVCALILSKNGTQTKATVISRMQADCDKVGPVAYSGGPPTRNDYYGTGRIHADRSVDNTTADATAPTFDSVTTIHYRAVDVKFSEPMGEGATDPSKYSFSNATGGNLAATPNKVIRIRPAVFRLVWTSGDMATTGNNTVALLSGISDVAGNALTGTTSRTCPGTKRIIALNSGNNYDTEGVGVYYVPPFDPDNDFQGNEWVADYVYFSVPSTYTSSTIDTSGVSNPAPQGVYQTIRHRWSDTSTIYYYIPNIPSNTKTIRLHFAEIYFNNIGDQVFDIVFNGSVVYSNFDILAQTGGVKNKAFVYEFSASPTPGAAIPIELAPKAGSGGIYNAAISGIEILKP